MSSFHAKNRGNLFRWFTIGHGLFTFYCAVLDRRIGAASSADERETLCLLRDCITDLMTQMINSAVKVTIPHKCGCLCGLYVMKMAGTGRDTI